MPSDHPFTYALNTSTIKGQNLTLEEEIDLAAEAGYDAIEPWIREIDRYQKNGGTLVDLRQRLDDRGLSLAGAIGFFEWIVDDDERRSEGFAEASRNMELVRELGGTQLAAPPFGAVDVNDLDLDRVAERYAELLKLGDSFGVTPLLELWGMSQTLGRLSEVMYVVAQCEHEGAMLLLDAYHLYKGGSPEHALGLLTGQAIGLFHINDYPASPPREQIADADRVYPGDGVAPLDDIIGTLYASGYRGTLSVELFNEQYWSQDALTVARTALEKTRAAVDRALG